MEKRIIWQNKKHRLVYHGARGYNIEFLSTLRGVWLESAQWSKTKNYYKQNDLAYQ